MDHINYTYEKLIKKRVNIKMPTEKRQHYKPLPRYNTETVSSSSSTTYTYRITHLKNPAISHERVTEMFSMRKQHIESFL